MFAICQKHQLRKHEPQKHERQKHERQNHQPLRTRRFTKELSIAGVRIRRGTLPISSLRLP